MHVRIQDDTINPDYVYRVETHPRTSMAGPRWSLTFHFRAGPSKSYTVDEQEKERVLYELSNPYVHVTPTVPHPSPYIPEPVYQPLTPQQPWMTNSEAGKDRR